jgi:hypothetical protein
VGCAKLKQERDITRARQGGSQLVGDEGREEGYLRRQFPQNLGKSAIIKFFKFDKVGVVQFYKFVADSALKKRPAGTETYKWAAPTVPNVKQKAQKGNAGARQTYNLSYGTLVTRYTLSSLFPIT